MLDNIKGIGPKTATNLTKIGIETKYDLITYYPYRFNVLKRSNVRDLETDDKIIIDGIVENNATVFFINKKMNKMQFRLNTGEYILKVSIFNRGFLKNKIIVGTKLTVIGKYDKKNSSIVASDIKFELLTETPKIEPIYHTISGISNSQINQFIKNALLETNSVDNYVPEYISEKYKLRNKLESIIEVHTPTTEKNLNKAINFLKYEELFIFMLKINFLKQSRLTEGGISRDIDQRKVEDFIKTLPFTLTEDQQNSLNEIKTDMSSTKVMKRLLQGDVGSGKTIVAIISLYMNYISGMQGALMAPTEVLAIQHYNTIIKVFEHTDIKFALLLGKTKAKERKEILTKLNNNEIDILIGTHALFSDDVVYNSLGLVVTDEQHRFGVNQRLLLSKKGNSPDILYLSATPIPRTYALTIYGDMDVTSIKTKPSGRLPVKTYVKKTTEIKNVLDMMQKELRLGHQIYVISPLIEESDKIELENVYELKEKMEKALGKIATIGLMHGKMNSEEKETAMTQFKENKTQILISTTVIEVGIDVSNATMIVIFDSYRFGLSQLHQLRGRVGRNEYENYCVLISDKETERLTVLEQTNDGFKISEEDFRLRGSGDLFGTRQSGDMKFLLADIKQDFPILLKAKNDSQELLDGKDYKDGKYPLIREMIDKITKNE